MATSITFNDGSSATLTNGKAVPADRFSGWTPTPITVKAEAESLATGQPYPYVFSVRQGATFSLPMIPNTSQATVLRLIAWLDAGGVITVNTGDAGTRAYSACYQPKGARAQYVLSDPRNLEYTLTLTVLSTAGSAMLCLY